MCVAMRLAPLTTAPCASSTRPLRVADVTFCCDALERAQSPAHRKTKIEHRQMGNFIELSPRNNDDPLKLIKFQCGLSGWRDWGLAESGRRAPGNHVLPVAI